MRRPVHGAVPQRRNPGRGVLSALQTMRAQNADLQRVLCRLPSGMRPDRIVSSWHRATRRSAPDWGASMIHIIRPPPLSLRPISTSNAAILPFRILYPPNANKSDCGATMAPLPPSRVIQHDRKADLHVRLPQEASSPELRRSNQTTATGLGRGMIDACKK